MQRHRAVARCRVSDNLVSAQVERALRLNLIPTQLAAYNDPALVNNSVLQGFIAQQRVATARLWLQRRSRNV
jgi:hypothetical protein